MISGDKKGRLKEIAVESWVTPTEISFFEHQIETEAGPKYWADKDLPFLLSEMVSPAAPMTTTEEAREAGLGWLLRLVNKYPHNGVCINIICRIWAETSRLDLAALIIEKGWFDNQGQAIGILQLLTSGLFNYNHRQYWWLAKFEVLRQLQADFRPPAVQGKVVQDGINGFRRSADPRFQLKEWVEQQGEYWSVWQHRQIVPFLNGEYAEPDRADNPLRRAVEEALANDDWESLTDDSGPEAVGWLVQATVSQVGEVEYAARQALQHLQRPDAQEALCQLVLADEWEVAQEAALVAGFRPAGTTDRALFYFLTEQWEAYDELDFDRRILRGIYQMADWKLRQRIAGKVRTSGQPTYLVILLDGRNRSSVGDLSPAELELTIQMLLEQKQWAQLWPMVTELTAAHSAALLYQIMLSDWRPTAPAERALFDQLAQYQIVRLWRAEDVKWNDDILPLRPWFERPLAHTQPEDLTGLMELLPAAAQEGAVILYIIRVLEYRFSHDIEIEAEFELSVAEFDIELG